MLEKIIAFSLRNKLIVLLLTLAVLDLDYSQFSKFQLDVPDVTNNQVQVITTSRNLSTQDIEQYITYPVEIEMANLPSVKKFALFQNLDYRL